MITATAAMAAASLLAAQDFDATAPASAVYDHAKPRLAARVLQAAATAAAAVAIYEYSDDALEFHPLEFVQAARAFNAPQFRAGGFGFSFAAISPRGPADLFGLSDFRSDARVMSRVIPGYPQPARVIVGVKASF